MGEQHEAGGDHVRRDPLAGPVAHLDVAIGRHLLDVHDVLDVEHREPGHLVQAVDQLGQVRTSCGDEAAAGKRAGGDVDEPTPDPVVATCAGLLDGTDVLQRREQAGHRALREARPARRSPRRRPGRRRGSAGPRTPARRTAPRTRRSRIPRCGTVPQGESRSATGSRRPPKNRIASRCCALLCATKEGGQ